MFSFSDNNDFEDILERLLSNVDDNLDKRQGSIIYDALAPAAAELAQCYIALEVYADQTYLLDTTGENLDNKVADYGLTRIPATYAQRIGVFTTNEEEPQPMTIEIGTVFGTPVEYGGINYTVTEEIETGRYILTCETAGTVGNEYSGLLLPVESVNNLGDAQLQDIYIAGEDAEDDERLRQRVIDKLNETAFGGNIADYKEFMLEQEGVGDCLVIPVWNGGGTVKLVVISNSYDIPTTAKIDELQTIVDPLQNQGQGIGKAPIGHSVTVVAPTSYNLTIEATINIESGYTIEGLQDAIETAIGNYILTVQKQWADSETITIYLSRIIAAIVTVEGVTNVSNLTINGEEEDVTINVTSTGNPYPMVEEIVLNEG